MAIRVLMLALCALLFGCASLTPTRSGPKFEPLTEFKPLAKRECTQSSANCPPVVLSVTPAECATNAAYNPNDKNQCEWAFADPIEVSGKKVTITWTLPAGFMFCVQNVVAVVMKDGVYFKPNKELEPLAPETPVPSTFGSCFLSYKAFNKRDAEGTITYPYQLVFRRTIDGAIVAIDPAMINKGS